MDEPDGTRLMVCETFVARRLAFDAKCWCAMGRITPACLVAFKMCCPKSTLSPRHGGHTVNGVLCYSDMRGYSETQFQRSGRGFHTSVIHDHILQNNPGEECVLIQAKKPATISTAAVTPCTHTSAVVLSSKHM